MRTLILAGIVAAMVGVGLSTSAQPPPPPEAEPGRLIETVRIWRMTEELELTEDQISEFFPKLKRLDDLEEEFSEKKAKAIMELDELLKSDQPSPSALKKKMGELENMEKESEKERAKLREEMRSVLSVEQQAQLIVFSFKFNREIRDIIRQIRSHRHGTGSPGERMPD